MEWTLYACKIYVYYMLGIAVDLHINLHSSSGMPEPSQILGYDRETPNMRFSLTLSLNIASSCVCLFNRL